MQRFEQNVGRGLYYWESFDLDPNVAGNSVFDRPLDFNVVANGSEALFSLPNGLQAYMIFDEAGNRLEESPILFDNAQNDNVLRAGISCMTCHENGTVQFQDEVRQFALDNQIDVAQAAEDAGGDFQDVLDLYPDNADLKEILVDDATNYRGALSDAGVPTNGNDPVSDSFINFDKDVRIAEDLKRYVVDIVRATRSAPGVQLGASPRASLALMKAAQALAVLDGRDYVTPENVQEIAVPVIAHRTMLDPQARFSGATAEAVVDDILNKVPVPA